MQPTAQNNICSPRPPDRLHADAEDEPAGRGGRVDVLGQGPETGTTSLDLVYDLEKVFQAAGKTVVFRDNDHIPVPQLLQQPVQLGSGLEGSSDRICEHPFCASGCQRVALAVRALVRGRDPSLS